MYNNDLDYIAVFLYRHDSFGILVRLNMVHTKLLIYCYFNYQSVPLEEMIGRACLKIPIQTDNSTNKRPTLQGSRIITKPKKLITNPVTVHPSLQSDNDDLPDLTWLTTVLLFQITNLYSGIGSE